MNRGLAAFVSVLLLGALAACRNDQPVAPKEPPHVGSGPNGTYHYAVAQGGVEDGTGATQESAWTLGHALDSRNESLSPGDTVWLLGGPDYSSDYVGPFDVTAHGTRGRPIVYKQFPGHTARIVHAGGFNSPISTLNVSYVAVWTEFRDFEVLNSSLDSRTTSVATNEWMPNSIYNQASHTRFVNLIIHDGGGLLNEPAPGQAGPADVLISGCIIYNNGWDGPSPGNDSGPRGHGHGLYLKNTSSTDSVTASDNVIFNNFGFGIHAFTNPGQGGLRNIKLRSNVAFNNGTLSRYGPYANIGNLGAEPAVRMAIERNMLYLSPDAVLNSSPNDTLPLRLGPNLVYKRPGTDHPNAVSSTRSLNYVIGGASPFTQGGTGDGWSVAAGGDDIKAAAWTSSNLVRWRITAGDPTRANVVIYSSGGAQSETVSLPAFLNPGDTYEVRNAQDWATVTSGTYGGSIDLSLSGVTPTTVGATDRDPVNTGPYFNVFVVTRTAAAPTSAASVLR